MTCFRSTWSLGVLCVFAVVLLLNACGGADCNEICDKYRDCMIEAGATTDQAVQDRAKCMADCEASDSDVMGCDSDCLNNDCETFLKCRAACRDDAG